MLRRKGNSSVLQVYIKRHEYIRAFVFRCVALISQWLTALGGLMLVVTDLSVLQDPQPENGKAIMSWIIMIFNAVSTSLYTMYTFFNC